MQRIEMFPPLLPIHFKEGDPQVFHHHQQSITIPGTRMMMMVGEVLTSSVYWRNNRKDGIFPSIEHHLPWRKWQFPFSVFLSYIMHKFKLLYGIDGEPKKCAIEIWIFFRTVRGSFLKAAISKNVDLIRTYCDENWFGIIIMVTWWRAGQQQ